MYYGSRGIIQDPRTHTNPQILYDAVAIIQKAHIFVLCCVRNYKAKYILDTLLLCMYF